MIPGMKITEELVQLQGQRFIASVQALDKRITEEPYEPCASDIAFKQARAEGRV